jgi:hypothetical protein
MSDAFQDAIANAPPGLDPAIANFLTAMAHLIQGVPAHAPAAARAASFVRSDIIHNPVHFSGDENGWLDYKFAIIARAETRGFVDVMKPSIREHPLLAPITDATDPRYNEYIEKVTALKAELSAGCKGRARHILMHTSSSDGAVCWQALSPRTNLTWRRTSQAPCRN